MRDQLILTDQTLVVAGAIVPHGRVCAELLRARGGYPGGQLTVDEIQRLGHAFDDEARGRSRVIVRRALADAATELRTAVGMLDLPALAAYRHMVSVFVWDAWRDGPNPDPTSHAAAGSAPGDDVGGTA